MNRQPTLANGTLTLRPLTSVDRADLYAAASDPITWAGHPATDRWKPEVFDPYFDTLLASKGTLVAVLDGKIIGCSRYYTPPEDNDGIAIGYTFLSHSHWGGTMNRRMKSLMLAHAFRDHDNVMFHIAPDNIRSQKATAKLGARFVRRSAMIVGGSEGDWTSFELSRADWEAAAKT